MLNRQNRNGWTRLPTICKSCLWLSKSIRPFPKKHTPFFQKAYYLLGKRSNLSKKRASLFKHHLNGIKTPFKRYYNSMEMLRHRKPIIISIIQRQISVVRESGGKEEGRLSEAEAGEEEERMEEKERKARHSLVVVKRREWRERPERRRSERSERL